MSSSRRRVTGELRHSEWPAPQGLARARRALGEQPNGVPRHGLEVSRHARIERQRIQTLGRILRNRQLKAALLQTARSGF